MINADRDLELIFDLQRFVYESGGNTLVTVKGVNSFNGLALKDKVVTVSAAALGGDNVSISGTGYTLALGSNVTKTKENIAKWSTLSGDNVAYLTGGSNAYYSLNSKKTAVTYNAAITPATKEIEFSGVKGTPTVSGSAIKLTDANFSSNVKVAKNPGDYALSLSGNFKNKTFTGSTDDDVIASSGSNLVISGGKGDDSITGSANVDKIAGDAGDDTLRGGAGADTLSGGAGDDSILGDAGNDSLVGGAGNDSLYGGKGNDSLWGDAGSDTFFYNNGDGKDILYGFDNSDILEITGTFTGTTNKSKKEVYIKVGSTSNAITLKNFTATTFNINDTDYKINGTKLVKK